MGNRFQKLTILVMLLLVMVACQQTMGEPAMVEVAPTATDHTHAEGEPEHAHLDDGSVLVTEGFPALNDDLIDLLAKNETIMVDAPNETVQTVALTIPTMF